MNKRTVRGFFLVTLALNILLVSMMLLDYFYANSRFFSAILVTMGVLVIITGVLMFLLEFSNEPTVQPVAVAEPRPVRDTLSAPQPKVRTIQLQPNVVGELAPADEDATMPFTYGEYRLYSRNVKLKGGGRRTIYFFSKRQPKSGAPSPKPVGYHVGVNERTGLPFLKKGGGADGEDLTPEIEHALRPQCGALTEDRKQCRNSARLGSKYCASHFGYQPPSIAAAEARRRDTMARVRDAPDTLPTIRRTA
jgi:hypothetical protein